jgi:hypothetical protein
VAERKLKKNNTKKKKKKKKKKKTGVKLGVNSENWGQVWC